MADSIQKTVILSGANGLLGQKLVENLAGRRSVNLIATSQGDNRILLREGYTYRPLDITNPAALRAIFEEFKPTEFINSAAMTNVDQCEKEKDLCWKINVEAVAEIVNLCREFGTRLIHLSTDFIFDGENGPYDERAKPNPLSWYGQSKLKGEEIIIGAGIPFLIIRTVLLYGIVADMSRSNIVLWARESLEEKKPIKVVNDQFRSPTLAEDLAEGVVLALMKGRQGIYHISGPDQMCITDIVYQVADFYGLDKSNITEVSSDSLGQPAKRPPKTGFIILKAQTELGYNPHSFQEGLAILDRQLREE
ncbi:MAG: NAD(P)-dependent oxidoreductase [Bacteroidia bacterium]|nr:NAD(P)-dependent oxidoreductase [Bacteroidia bacterium]